LGLDPNDERDLFQQMDNVARHYLISSTEFRAWADKVEEDAKIICNDPRGERIRFVITEKSGRFTIDVGKANALTFACIIRAIRQNFDGMPDNLSMWYMALLRYLEIQEEKFQTR
jgi:hypothetical protein